MSTSPPHRLGPLFLGALLLTATLAATLSAQDRAHSAIPSGTPGLGTGDHYWIDGASGNDGNPGTRARPWRTVDRLESATLGPGDLVHVQAGVYPVQSSLRLIGITGLAQAWIGIQAEGPVVLENSAVQNVINVEDCHYLLLRGLEITHDNQGKPYGAWDPVDGIKFQNTSSDHVTIDSCHIHHVGNVGVSSQAPVVQHLSLVNTEIEHCFIGVYWGYYEAANKRYAHDCTIARNYVHHCPPVDLDGRGYGIQIKGGSRGNVIQDNVLVEVAGNTRAAIAVYHISTNAGPETRRNVIRGNFIRASRAEGIYAAEGAVIENNILVDVASYAINVTPRNTGGWGVFYGNLALRQNTVYRVQNGNGVALSVAGGSFTGPLDVLNNVLLTTGSGQYALRLPAGFSGRSMANHCFGRTSGPAGGVVPLPDLSALISTTYGDPDFLFPAPNGALVDAGQPRLVSDRDFHGTPRDWQPDVGAYESTGGGNPGARLGDGFKILAPRTRIR